jgi:hypothetical protein
MAGGVVADTPVFHNCMEGTVNYKTYLILYKVFKNTLSAIKNKIKYKYYIFLFYFLVYFFLFFIFYFLLYDTYMLI